MLNRRQFSFTTAAAALASITPALAAPGKSFFDLDQNRELTATRIFGYQPPANWINRNLPYLGFQLRTRFSPEYHYNEVGVPFFPDKTFPQMAFSILKVTNEQPDIKSSTVNHLEHIYMRACPVLEADCSINELHPIHPYPTSIFWLNRGRTAVAKATRRGKGNAFIAHLDTIKLYEAFRYTEDECKTFWYDDNTMNKNEVFVFYRGESVYDRAGVLFANHTVKLAEVWDNNKLAYGRMVTFPC